MISRGALIDKYRVEQRLRAPGRLLHLSGDPMTARKGIAKRPRKTSQRIGGSSVRHPRVGAAELDEVISIAREQVANAARRAQLERHWRALHACLAVLSETRGNPSDVDEPTEHPYAPLFFELLREEQRTLSDWSVYTEIDRPDHRECAAEYLTTQNEAVAERHAARRILVERGYSHYEAVRATGYAGVQSSQLPPSEVKRVERAARSRRAELQARLDILRSKRAEKDVDDGSLFDFRYLVVPVLDRAITETARTVQRLQRTPRRRRK